ncbi:nitroreductase [Pseudonocardia sp. NPDC049154]|uniref:nitroreductase n=1 Tax=Pseudonocardia sp. NPDC049154 TaxID=3155501 RepID=UPI0033F70A05
MTVPTVGDRIEADVLDRVLAERWSCRGFRKEPVDPAVVEEVLDAARHAPSWCNTQPWRVHVLSGAALGRFRAGLVQRVEAGPREEPDFDFPQAYTGVHADRRRASGWQLYEAVGIERGDRAASAREMLRNFDCFGAPHVAIVTTATELGVYGAVDCGVFVQSFLLAAHVRGLGAIPQAALASQAPFIREFLSLGEDRRVLLGISFGRPDADHPTNSYRTGRQSVSEFATIVDA